VVFAVNFLWQVGPAIFILVKWDKLYREGAEFERKREELETMAIEGMLPASCKWPRQWSIRGRESISHIESCYHVAMRDRETLAHPDLPLASSSSILRMGSLRTGSLRMGKRSHSPGR
jgi:hypothetical protein